MPSKKWNALTGVEVQRKKTPGMYADGNGLNLKVDPSGAKRWVLRVTIAGKRHNLGLGGYPSVGLREARERADEYQRAIRQGRDPLAEIRQAAVMSRRPETPTFQEMAEEVIKFRQQTWSSNRHRTQWEQSLKKYAYPAVGSKPIDEVTSNDVLTILEPIWIGNHETAKRVRQRLSVIFERAMARGWRQDNPAGDRVSGGLVPVRQVIVNHPALPFAEVPSALQRVRESSAALETRLSFEFLVLTASRAGEVRGAEWSEFDWDGGTWTVPASRMKSRAMHRVPLATRALEVLEEARSLNRRDSGLVFPNRGSGKALSNMAFSAMLKRLNIDAVPHGFRSSFRDWLSETIHPPEGVGERALAHRLSSRLEARYARSDLFDARRVVMDAWSGFLTSGTPDNEWTNVRAELQVEISKVLLANGLSSLANLGNR